MKLNFGVNMRIQPLQAVVAQIEHKKLNKVINKNSNAKFLDKKLNKLKGYVKIPHRKKVNLETFSLYMATFKQRDELKDFYKKMILKQKFIIQYLYINKKQLDLIVNLMKKI